ncbi:ACP S-malonyltransferase [uncultured Candidatus Kuenenia sp.]|uniref:ACP S-malonyltransferase n=1 Tax=uncultured Candidatus Kuenenia sp. TaxID=1048336 RepID=UPI0002FE68D3|nr:ACP S-malonyltransferase [uncultured Candidatus Kuenenia sp.]TVM02460.1 MAG: [acyl-carrier-protein] S-malonyltransferase [Candidatus Kuenenia stuttgartiensis]
MRKTAFLFPGQGTQLVGMGKDFYKEYKEAREIFNQANDALGFDLASLCFEGNQEELNKTSLSQPAILVTSIAILEVLKEISFFKKTTCDAVAGLSLGEYTAHVSAGSVAFADAVKLVYKRGIYMQEACEKSSGGMASVIGLEDKKIEHICRELNPLGVICAANYNSPGQVVISGESNVLERAVLLAKERGARMVIPLKVQGAFHSGLMTPASDKLYSELESTVISKPGVPVVANINAEYVSNPEEIRTALIKQLNSPVKWYQSMQKLIHDGFSQFYEIGPGKTLSGLMKKIDPAQQVKSFSTIADL